MAFVKLYDRKNALVATDLLNDKVVPFFEEEDVRLLRILTDRGSEYCGNREQHEYQLYLSIEDIDHTRTRARSPQTNGICERFHKTILNEFYQIALRKKLYQNLADTTPNDRIRADTVMARRRWRLLPSQSTWQMKRSWTTRSGGRTIN